LKLPLKRVKEYEHCYMTHDEQYMVQQRDDTKWYWAVRLFNTPSYQVIDDNTYRTRKDCLYALSDYMKEQEQELQLWGE
jgi:hypothetical protein